MYNVKWGRQAKKDYVIAERNGYADKVAEMLSVICDDPFDPNPPEHQFEELKGALKGTYSRRIDYNNRFTYKVFENDENLLDKHGMPYEGIVRILTMWGHPY